MLRNLKVYWAIYGGWRALFTSEYFWIAVALTAITPYFWLNKEWWLQVTAVLPNLLGFTIGGFAIFLGVGDERFREIIAGRTEDDGDDEHSPFREVCAAFVHFAVVQFLALMLAIVVGALQFEAPSWLLCWQSWITVGNVIASAVGYFLFLYGLMLAIATVFAIFDISGWYDEWRTNQNAKKDTSSAAQKNP